jgi:sulfhydrogenase subunit gamma (sulfur reductase)
MTTPYAIHPARIVSRRVETEGIYTYGMRIADRAVRDLYSFRAGQFNMVYAFGVGEVAISIVSDPDEPAVIEHTIRAVGRVTEVMGRWKVGDVAGVRGPYGNGWPLEIARGRDVVIVTGGVGCAPVVGVINYIFRRRPHYGHLQILHGIKTARDLLYRDKFEEWRRAPRTRVLLSSDRPDKAWHYKIGVVTELFDELEITPSTIVMMCGPEVMMRYGGRALVSKGVPEDAIFLSLERRMECAVGLCGHCQYREHFVCKDGPIFDYRTARPLLATPDI